MKSWSHNGEDALLCEVFDDVSAGFYVDVGAGPPDKTSNTFALYRRGWRGIAVDPLLAVYEDWWRQMRPGDVLVKGAAASRSGPIDFYYSSQLQFSTGSQRIIDYWRSDINTTIGAPDQAAGYALNDVLRQHPLPEIHLLNLDIEGMEGEALAGLDLRRHRPWLMMIEARMPGELENMSVDWEPGVLAAGYAMAHDDGCNRFYVADERAALRCKFQAKEATKWQTFLSG